MELELRPHHDHRTTGIVNALAKKVLTEATLFAFQHIGKGFQRPLVSTRDHPTAAPVIKERINGFLKHALFVADNDVRRAQFDQTFQTVVPVDHPAIEIIEVRGCKPAAIKRDQRAQFRRNDRNNLQNHPFRTIP